MFATLRQLSAIYLTAASAFTIAIVLSQHPDLDHAARGAGLSARSFVIASADSLNAHVVRPGVDFVEDSGSAAFKWAADMLSPPVRVARSEPKHAGPVRMARAEPVPPPPVVKDAVPPLQPDNDEQTNQTTSAEPGSDAAVVPDQQNAMADADGSNAAPPPLKPDVANPDEPATPMVLADNSRKARPVEPPKPVVVPPPQLAPEPDTAVRPTVSHAGPAPGELIRVAERLKQNLTPELMSNFELFLYVSKADTGSWSQRMYVFAKKADGDLALQYNWPVSTGREKWEVDVNGHRQNSITPQGYYELDPDRMHVKYHSGQWNQPMPYAMFFNWQQNGYQTGLAIHAATGDDVALLGQRASAGCIRLSADNARALFTLIRGQYKGLAPRFAIDRRTATMDNNGLLVHDKNGKVLYSEGYKVLVFVENYGGNDVVAALF